jgi:hypothetical protein
MTNPLQQAIARSRYLEIEIEPGYAWKGAAFALDNEPKFREAAAIMAEALERIQNYDLEHNDPLVDCALRQWSKEALAKANALFEEGKWC